jgi:hypothetical protein
MHKIILSILLIPFCVSIVSPNVFARPITEPTEKNITEFNIHFDKHFEVYCNEIGLFCDIPITHPYIIEIKTLKELGIFGKENSFYPRKKIKPFDFYLWFIFTIKKNTSKITYQEFLNKNDRQRKVFLDSINRKLDNNESIIIDRLDDNSLSFRDALQILKLSKSKINQNQKINRLTALTLLIEALKSSELMEDLKAENLNIFNYQNLINDTPIELKLDNDYFIVNGKPLKGLFVNWMEDFFVLSKTEILNTISVLKENKIIGVSIEIGWDRLEPEEGDYEFPEEMDFLLTELAKNGMYVHLLISPHYTPPWLFEKYGEIRMMDREGVFHNEGEYATYSFYSPAVQDQITLQKKAISYYKKFPNIISFLLGNEQSYGRLNDLDYSVWAIDAWRDFLISRNEQFVEPNNNLKLWQRFRQLGLNQYFTHVYNEVKKVQEKIPLSFKFIPYENTSAFSPNYGLHLSAKEIKTDFLAVDIYGFTPNTYSLKYQFDMPKIVLETNMPGDWSEENMFKYLILNYIKGIPLQSVFAWLKGDFENALLYPDGTYWEKTHALKRASELIQYLEMPKTKSSTAIIIPTNGLNLYGWDYLNYQYKLDDLINNIFETEHIYPVILWSGNLSDSSRHNWEYSELEQFLDIIILDSKIDPISNIYIENLNIHTTPENYMSSKG